MKKRITAILIASVTSVSIIGCGSNNAGSAISSSASDTSSSTIELDTSKIDEITEEIKDSISSGSEENETSSDISSEESVIDSSSEESGSSSIEEDASDDSAPKTADLASEILNTLYPDEDPHAYLFDTSESYEEYQIYYQDGLLMERLIDLCFFSQDYYTEDDINSIDIDSIYPGIYDLDFAEVYLDDLSGYYVITIIWDDMTNGENSEAMVDNGYIALSSGDASEGINADSYGKLLEDNGCSEIDL